MTALTARVGDEVICPNPGSYLRERHGVQPGRTIGRIVDDSRLSPTDDGLLVDWGTGERVRCSRDELSAVSASRWRIVVNRTAGSINLDADADGSLGRTLTGEDGRRELGYGSAAAFRLIIDAYELGYLVTGIELHHEDAVAQSIFGDINQAVCNAITAHDPREVLGSLVSRRIFVDAVTFTRNGADTTVHRDGSYVAGDDLLFSQVIAPQWLASRPTPRPVRGPWWKRRDRG